ncbi:MAG: helix-hairpin-helix domain-containing protein [Blautia sp.]|nr:helix-hairpin-helix domain-containing protein [Blautia sp.]
MNCNILNICFLAALFSLAATGCGKTDRFADSVLIESTQSEEQITGPDGDAAMAAPDEPPALSDPDGFAAFSDSSGGFPAEGEPAVPQEEAGTPEIYVDIMGAVNSPGVYCLKEGSRVFEGIEMAGGFREDAAVWSLNKAEPLYDGQCLYVLSEEEAAGEGLTVSDFYPVPFSERKTKESAAQGQPADELCAPAAGIDRNRASLEDLCTLPGIGKTKAEAILAYRQEHGAFHSIEEIMEVEGIKEGIFNSIKDDIYIEGS